MLWESFISADALKGVCFCVQATKVFEEDQPVLKDHRDRELTEKKKQYQSVVQCYMFVMHFRSKENTLH